MTSVERFETYTPLALSLAKSKIRRSRAQGYDVECLHQAALIGLWNAVEAFKDESRAFEPLAVVCIRRTLAAVAKDRWGSRLRRERVTLSLSQAFGDDGHCVQVADECAGQEQRQAEDVEHLTALLATLPPRELHILGLYYGHGLTLEEIGDGEGISLERVRQILEKTLALLRLRANKRSSAAIDQLRP